jgi:hypothetical protein
VAEDEAGRGLGQAIDLVTWDLEMTDETDPLKLFLMARDKMRVYMEPGDE